MFFLNYSPYIFSTPIRWYAFFVLFGAYMALTFAKKHYKQDERSKKHPNLIDDLFIVVFPSGLLGARIWFVLSEIDSMSFFDIFRIWQGGLAIQGGVLGGILAGIIYYRVKKIQFPFWRLFDVVVPNILIAQAIGRWGNFFNQEVYGQCVQPSSLWFVPTFVINNMGVPSCQQGLVAQPLFLYESILTLGGFLILSIVLRKLWTSRKDGDLASLYLIYYGVIRIIMEPLRNETYIMRVFGDLSFAIFTSIIFIVVGLGLMAYSRFYIDKGKKEVK